MNTDVLVVGAGLAGSLAALAATGAGRRVTLVYAGEPALHIESGCIDLWADTSPAARGSPRAAIAALAREQPDHPYALAGLPALESGLALFRQCTAAAGYPYTGSLDAVLAIPTVLGTLRPAGLVPPTMAAGHFPGPDSLLVVGIEGIPDLHPELAAENLRARLGIPVRAAAVVVRPGEPHVPTPVQLAAWLDTPDGCSAFWAEVARVYRGEAAVALPPVLGMAAAPAVLAAGQRTLGCRVFELPALSPSVPGMRLAAALRRALKAAGVRLVNALAVAGTRAGPRATGVRLEGPGEHRRVGCRALVLATGGLLGGSFVMDESGDRLQERLFGLPVAGLGERDGWTRPDWLDPRGQPLSRAGLAAGARLQPLGPDGRPELENVFLAGRVLAHQDPELERCGHGVAIATGHRAGLLAAEVN